MKSRVKCDKKCTGVAKGIELMGGKYLLDMNIKKGKVMVANCKIVNNGELQENVQDNISLFYFT